MGIGNLVNKPCHCGSGKKYKKCCMNKDVLGIGRLLIPKIAITDKKGIKHPIDDDIGRLLSVKGEGEVTEQDFKSVLKRYSLRDNLILIGDISRYVFQGNTEGLGRIGYREENTDILISQFSLAYIANMLILSGASDDSGDNFKDNPYSLFVLCNIYNNKLISPDLVKINEGMKKFDNDDFLSFMVRMWYEQMSSFQFNQLCLMSRNIVFFFDLAGKIIPDKFEKLSDIFFKENKITMEEYLQIGFGFLAGVKDRIIFSSSYLATAKIPEFENIYTEEKVNSFLEIVAADYKKFKDLDKELNDDLSSVYTKNRFNPLFIFPLVKENINSQDAYIMPNVSTYMFKIYSGIFWWFHNYFETTGRDKKMHLHYRTYFGKIFEQYVGLILKDIYGLANVNSEFSYSRGSNMFTDWYIIKENKCYLFEAKAYQFALLSRQTGDLEAIVNNELKKIAASVVEMFKTIKDIDQYEELKNLRGKTFIPVIVFLEIPLASSAIYKEKVANLLSKMEEKNTDLIGLKDFDYHLLNIDELEVYEVVKDKIEIEDIFNNIKNDKSQGFVSYVTRINGNQPSNKFLDKVYNDFWREKLKRK
ncbi:MAG: SEC-C metal-binding domain-containing protein [Patescibacteria group bacterium]